MNPLKNYAGGGGSRDEATVAIVRYYSLAMHYPQLAQWHYNGFLYIPIPHCG